MAVPKKPAGSGNRLTAQATATGHATATRGPVASRAQDFAPDLSFLNQASYTGGSSYGAGTPGYSAAADPTYQAYLNSLDLEAAQRQAQTQQRRAFLEADRDTMIADTGRDAELQREGISDSYEDRGLYQSGAHEGDLARSRGNQLSREGRIQTEAGRGISDLESALAQAMAQIQLKRQSASQGIFG